MKNDKWKMKPFGTALGSLLCSNTVTHAVMAIASSQIQIRDIKEIPELRAVEELQKEIWGCNDREVLPSLALIPLLEIGGVLLGAFDDEQLIGFVLGFPGTEGGRAILHSDMLAIKSAYRSRDLGFELKLAQRERALAKGIDKITWTFDPLQSRNAHLNFGKLGVIADRYRINYYGETSSFLHRTATDRLWVTWHLNSARVQKRLQGVSASRNDCRGVPPWAPPVRNGNLIPPRDIPTPTPILIEVGDKEDPQILNQPFEDEVIIEIPSDINRLFNEDLELAVRWREATRHAFTIAIDAGLSVQEFCKPEQDDRNVGRYLLQRTLPRNL